MAWSYMATDQEARHRRRLRRLAMILYNNICMALANRLVPAICIDRWCLTTVSDTIWTFLGGYITIFFSCTWH